MRFYTLVRGLVALAGLAGLAGPARPQTSAAAAERSYPQHTPPGTGGAARVPLLPEAGSPLMYLGVNLSLAGLSALVPAGRDVPPLTHRLAGALGGGIVMYAGQRIVGSGEPLMLLLGQQVVAVGANMARNSGRGVGPFEDLVLPLYPFYLQVQPGGDRPVGIRLSVAALVGAVQMGLEYHATPDLLASLRNGAVTYHRSGQMLDCRLYHRSGCAQPRLGSHMFGSVIYVDAPQFSTQGAVRAHELSHVTQDTRDAILFALPASDRVFSDSNAISRWLRRFVVLDVAQPTRFLNVTVLSRAVGGVCDHESFYECEVEAALSGRGRPPRPARPRD